MPSAAAWHRRAASFLRKYHSCGNRHCPNCGGLKWEQWLQDRLGELLPTSYFHIVFTLPQQLRSVAMGKDEKYLGGMPGIIGVLHTNGQDLNFHPHVHCIATGGGLSKAGKWIAQKRKQGDFLFPGRAMKKIYKGYFLDRLQGFAAAGTLKAEDKTGFETLLREVRLMKWNVYAKAPFAGPQQIMEYLGRYTHKVAISTHRIIEITETDITFRYKDYKDGNKQKSMTLSHEEFLRRFEQHYLSRFLSGYCPKDL